MIRAGRDGQVKWDPAGGAGAAATALLSIKSWQLSAKTEKIPVTCFQDTNRVYVPGLPEIAGSLAGHWNSADVSLWTASRATTPGYIFLIPHTSDTVTGPPVAPRAFQGLAYLDAEINTDVDGAPEVTGTIMAAGPWTFPVAALTE